MSAKDEIQKNYEEEMKFVTQYMETQNGHILNWMTRMEKMLIAIVNYLDSKEI
jgi:hypothetical protein